MSNALSPNNLALLEEAAGLLTEKDARMLLATCEAAAKDQHGGVAVLLRDVAGIACARLEELRGGSQTVMLDPDGGEVAATWDAVRWPDNLADLQFCSKLFYRWAALDSTETGAYFQRIVGAVLLAIISPVQREVRDLRRLERGNRTYWLPPEPENI